MRGCKTDGHDSTWIGVCRRLRITELAFVVVPAWFVVCKCARVFVRFSVLCLCPYSCPSSCARLEVISAQS